MAKKNLPLLPTTVTTPATITNTATGAKASAPVGQSSSWSKFLEIARQEEERKAEEERKKKEQEEAAKKAAQNLAQNSGNASGTSLPSITLPSTSSAQNNQQGNALDVIRNLSNALGVTNSLVPAGNQTQSSAPSSMFSDDLAKNYYNKALQYTQYGPQATGNLANSLVNFDIGDYNGKSVSDLDWDILRSIGIRNETYKDWHRSAGTFDSPEYLTAESITLPSTGYIKQNIDSVGAELTESLKRDEAAKAANDYRVNSWQQWSDMQNRLGEMNEENAPWFYAYADYLTNGDLSKPFDMDAYDAAWNDMDDDSYWADMAAKEKLFNSLDWATLTDKSADRTAYESQTPSIQEQYDLLSGEATRRAREEELNALATASPNYGQPYTPVDVLTSAGHAIYDFLGIEPDLQEQFQNKSNFINGWNAYRESVMGNSDDPESFADFMRNIEGHVRQFFGVGEGADAISPIVQQYINEGLHYMPDYMVKNYDVLLKDDPALAEEYLEVTRPTRLQIKADVEREYYQTRAEDLGYGALDNTISLFTKPLNTLYTGIGMLAGEEDPNAGIYGLNRQIGTTRSTFNETVGKTFPYELFGVNIAQFGLGLATSIGDMAVANKIGSIAGSFAGNTQQAANIGKNVMGWVMASEVGADTFHEDLERGMDYEYSLFHAGLNMAINRWAESGFLDELFDGSGGFWKRVKAGSLSEGGEEVFEGGANIVSDSFVSYLAGVESELQETYKYYKNTVGEKDAGLATLQHYAKQAAIEFTSGAITGGTMNAASYAGEYNANTTTGKTIREQGDPDRILAIAAGMNEGTESKRIADEVTARMEKNPDKGITNYELGQLTGALAKDLGEEKSKALDKVQDKAIEDRLVELGDSPETAKKNAPAVRKLSRGQKLTLQERAAIDWNDNMNQVVQELSRETEDVKPSAPGAIEDVGAKEIDGKWVAGSAQEAEANRTGNKWVTDMKAAQIDATGEYAGKQFQLEMAVRTPSVSKVVERATEKAKAKVEKTGGKFAGKPTSTHVSYTDAETKTESSGELLRFEQTDDGIVAVLQGEGKTNSGEKHVKPTEILIADGEGVQTILEYVTDENLPHEVTAEEANALLQSYKATGGNASTFIEAFESSYLRGYSGMKDTASALDPRLAKIAYDHGKAEAEKYEATRVERAKAARKVTNPSVGWIGEIEGDATISGKGDSAALDAEVENMTDGQKLMVNYGKALAKHAGINVVFYRSKAGADGEITTDNGRYVAATHTIYLDINAGVSNTASLDKAKAEGTLGYAMSRTLGHEVTHAIEATSVEYYAKYKQAVKNALSEKGKDWSLLVRDRIDQALADGKKMTYAEAEAEVVADASEYMLQDAKITQELEPGLYNKIKSVVQNFVTKLNDVFRELGLKGSVESRALREMRDGVYHYMGGLQELWGAAFDEMAGVEEVAIADGVEDALYKTGDVYDNTAQSSARVNDKATIDYLENQQHITTYRAMQVIDGELYPPMAEFIGSKKDGNREDASAIGQWEMATEHPELIKWVDGKPKFELKKVNDDGSVSTVPAAYNPYMHSSNTVLNDQFSKAFQRKNLVVVECVVPVSESDGAYQAQYAKDATGWHEWKSGIVAGDLAKKKSGFRRDVFLSRYIKPVRILSDTEVAEKIAGYLDSTDVTVPFQSAWPTLRDELVKAGVNVTEPRGLGPSQMKIAMEAFDEWKNQQGTESKTAEYNYQSSPRIGYTADGIPVYKSNFPEGSTQPERQARVLDLVRNVWANNPIALEIVRNGKTEQIVARFDPWVDPEGNIISDATKLAFGNRKGTKSDRKTTQKLADDFPEIISTSRYDRPGNEIGKTTHPHEGVLVWHYFANRIGFVNDDGGYAEYNVSIDVKEKADGHFVYSVAAVKEKGSERNNAPSLYSSPGTMNAPVNESGFSPATATNTVPHAPEVVNSISETSETPDGIDISEDTDSATFQSSARTWYESDYIAKRDETAERLAKSIGVPVEQASKWIDDVTSIAAYVLDNKARVDYIPTAVKGVSAFKSNPEYGGSIDMSTICAKRRLATGTLDAIQRVLGDEVLTKDDFLRIREMMKERGHEVACGLCFVESSRKNLSKYNAQFMEQYNSTHPDGEISMTDLNTVDGLENLRVNNEDAYSEYEKFMNKLAQRKPKLFEKRTEYEHEILKRFKSDETVGVKNRNGGLRLQSFSDFEIVHLIDMMQVITDMASVGLAGQAYTKVPEFAWALGNTGLKINLSLIAKGVDADGTLIFDDVEGMPYKEAKKLRDAYSKNVGTVVVTFTDEQLTAAMKSDFVDYIIPFHRSQWQKSDYKKLGLPEGTKDYTLHQNEKQGRKRVKENFLPNAYWDPDLSGNENAKVYLKMCEADGRTPKFAKFLSKDADGHWVAPDGYWKLLIDFKMYDNSGKGSPQMPVQPNFNMDMAMEMLENYKGTHDSFPVAQDVVDDFVQEYRDGKGGVKKDGEKYTIAPYQSSARTGLPEEPSVRGYLSESDDSIAETVEERNALTIYQQRLKEHADAVAATMAAEEEVRKADISERFGAIGKLNHARTKQRELYNRLVSVENTPHVQSVMTRAQQMINEDLYGKSEEDVAQMISDLEQKVSQLSATLEDLHGAARTQQEMEIAHYEKKIKQLKNLANKQVTNLRRQMDAIRERRDLNLEIGKKARHIKKVVKKLNDLIVHETDYKNVKEPLKPAVYELVKSFTENFGDLVFDRQTADRLNRLYTELAQNEDTAEYYDEEVASWMTELASLAERDAERRKSGSTLASLNEKLYIYTTLSDIADHVSHLVTGADMMFIEGKKAAISAVTEEVGNDLLAKVDRRRLAGKLGKIADFADNLIVKGNMIPQYFFEGLKNKGMMKLYDDLQNGTKVYAERLLTGEEFLADAMKRHGYHTWGDMKKPVSFKTQQGHTVYMTRENMMCAYAIAKREASNPIMETHHLDEGGFVYDKDSIPTEGFKEVEGAQKHHKLVKEDIAKITSMLTAEQIAFMDECVEFMSTDCAAWGNEASRQLYGIDKYKENYYFPFKVDHGQIRKDSAAGATSATNDARVKHTSFTHALRNGANTPVVLGNFTDIVADHINQMATYSALVVPIENMNRVLNRKVDDDGDMVTIRSLIGRKNGVNSEKYIADLLRDLNGGPQTDNRGSLDAGIRMFKRNAVVGKMSVAIQQPTAIARAFAYINPKYFVGIKAERPKQTWERMMQYSGTAVLKDMGGFNVGLGKQAADWVARGDLGDYNIFKRAKFLLDQKGFTAAKSEWVDFLTGLPGWMDKITWCAIWNATEREMAAKYPRMDRNGEEFLTLVGQRFDDIVNHTQVYDSILSKSQNMRSKNALAKMATSFMAESTLNMNMLYSAAVSKDKKRIAQTFSAWLLNAILGAAAYALVGSWNKDDDERTAEEKYWAAFASRFADNVNPFASIPYLADVWNKIQGYDVERTDMSFILDVAEYGMDFLTKLVDPDKAVGYRDYENFVGSVVSAATGVPLKNWMGDARRVYNAMTTSTEDAPESRVWYGIWDEILPWRKSNNASYYERYLAAIKDGDKQEMYDLKDYLTATKGVKEETIMSGVRDTYKTEYQRGGITKEEAVTFLEKHGLAKDRKSAFEYVDKWGEGNDGYSAYNTVYEAALKQDNAGVKNAIDELVKNGWVEEKIRTQLRTYINSQYMDGEVTQEQVKSIYKKYCLPDDFDKNDSNDWYWLFKKLDYGKKNGGSLDGWSAYNDLKAAFATGNSTKIWDAWRELAAHGYKEDTVNSYVRTNIIKPMLLDGEITEAQATSLLRTYASYKKDSDNVNKPKEWLQAK